MKYLKDKLFSMQLLFLFYELILLIKYESFRPKGKGCKTSKGRTGFSSQKRMLLSTEHILERNDILLVYYCESTNNDDSKSDISKLSLSDILDIKPIHYFICLFKMFMNITDTTGDCEEPIQFAEIQDLMLKGYKTLDEFRSKMVIRGVQKLGSPLKYDINFDGEPNSNFIKMLCPIEEKKLCN